MTPSQSIVDSGMSSYDFSDLGYLNNLPAYNTYEGVDRLLDLSREIFNSGAYYPLIVPFPRATSAGVVIVARQQISGTIIVPKGSILYALSGYADNGVSPNVVGNQFMVRIYDSVTGNDLLDPMWGWGTNIAPPMIDGLASSSTNDVMGLHLFSDPFVTIADNSLQVTVMNAASTDRTVQVALHFAVPYSKTVKTSHPIVEGVS